MKLTLQHIETLRALNRCLETNNLVTEFLFIMFKLKNSRFPERENSLDITKDIDELVRRIDAIGYDKR